MGNIVLLDDLTINKIAAGEVIERPANVVKELVENSLDAKASHIIIEIKNGGKSYIKITDDGKGISKDDMPISIIRHATSKINKIEDLENCYTMGFRGEALASISAISKLTMVSKTENENVAIKIISEAGNILNSEECISQIGTSICVENLFFNTPVRYKFLKNDVTELKYIKEWILKVALANPSVAFKLINNGKTIFSSNGNGKLTDVVYQIYGKEIEQNLINVDFEEENIKITGVIGNTMIAKENRKDQILFLNKRNIKNAMLTNIADQAFKGGTGIGKYGFYILNLSMPADYYDVNVHPTKMEVRFKDNKICKILYHAIKTSMLNSEFLGNSEISENDKYVDDEYEFLNNNFQNKDIFRENENLIKRKNRRKIEYKYIGIIFKTFIVIEIDNEIFLIDQHAAHERVLYEKIKENYKNNMQNNTQMMLIPQIYNLSIKELEFVNENIELLQKTGFDIEFFGNNSIKINGIPDLEYKCKTQNIFFDILDEMISNERTAIKDIEERFIATVACKAAVKANMDLTYFEVQKLIDDLLELNNPYTCPHGRPTTIKFDKDYFKKNIG